jgi:hypothetical protein
VILGCSEIVPGTCYENPAGGAGGADSLAVGAGVGATTSGDYAEPPKGPLETGDGDSSCSNPCLECPTRLDTWLNCRGLDAVQCMEKCAEAGAACAPRMKHPKKPEDGWGDLYMCKTGFPTHVCSYYYSNGDECIFFSPIGRIPWCVYIGGRP